jgi:hypothetical protein
LTNGVPVSWSTRKLTKKKPKKRTFRMRIKYPHQLSLAGFGKRLFKYITAKGKTSAAKFAILAEITRSVVGKAKWMMNPMKKTAH